MDPNEEIAIPVMNTIKSISSEEFQGLLTSWYEEKGILSQLRTQLRHKLINVLKNTAIGRDITRNTSQTSVSLSKQAINLIVAEFLMKSKCDYSLSVFNTEVGLSSTYCESLMNESGKVTLQFNKENIVNILELVGIYKLSQLCDDILTDYYENSDTPLLSCLINTLAKSLIDKYQVPDSTQRSQIDLTAESDFIRKTGNVLMNLNVPLENIPHILEMIKGLHESELKSIEENFNRNLLKLKKALSTKDRQIEQTRKKKKLIQVNLVKIMGDYNALKHHMKSIIKDKLLKEKEITNLKEKNKDNIETFANKIVSEKTEERICSLDHCGEQCKENNNLLFQLQSENQELQRINTKQAMDIYELQKKYNDLLHDFHFLQNKVSLLDNKVNEEVPLSHLNLNLIDGDVKYSNKGHRYKKVDINDISDSLTDDIIRDARLRLEQLENESKEIAEYDKCCIKELV